MARDLEFGEFVYDLLDLTDHENRTALHIACLHNAVDSVKYLLKYYHARVQIERVSKKAGCMSCRNKIYSLEAFVNARDKYGNTPLVMASKCFVRNADQTALLQVILGWLFNFLHLAVPLNHVCVCVCVFRWYMSC